MPVLETFSTAELTRYHRQILLPELDVGGQARLKAGSVLCVGAGGLGAPAALYLAAAGVGRVGLVDFDVVDVSNLHRQILFRTADVGASKVEAAKATLQGLNPAIAVEAHEVRLAADNIRSLVAGYDVVIDGADNFPTRYLVNDACAALGKPVVWAAIYRFEGQIAVFDAARGPCYRCLFPDPPDPGLVPSCADGGVLGVLPGLLGVFQASEAIKLIAGIGEPLIGRVLLFDALRGQFDEVTLPKAPGCPVCGSAPASLVTAPDLCGPWHAEARAEATAGKGEAGRALPPGPDTWAISPENLAGRLVQGGRVVLVDCREPFERAISLIEPSVSLPTREMPDRFEELDAKAEIVIYCHHGHRSANAAAFLRQFGFRKVWYLEGGIDAWARRIAPDLPRY